MRNVALIMFADALALISLALFAAGVLVWVL